MDLGTTRFIALLAVLPAWLKYPLIAFRTHALNPAARVVLCAWLKSSAAGKSRVFQTHVHKWSPGWSSGYPRMLLLELVLGFESREG